MGRRAGLNQSVDNTPRQAAHRAYTTDEQRAVMTERGIDARFLARGLVQEG